MILHSLRVLHWRNLITPIELGPFSDRLNVIHAPNGTGKSSVFEAMRRALFDTHHVTGTEIEAVRPWGRSLAPQVHVEFTQSGVRYRVEKIFLDGASARLLRFEDGKFQPLADSRNADAQLREIIAAADAPGRGLSKREHWGLAEVLWAPQGLLHMETISPSVAENVRAALGVQLNGATGSRLEALVEERYESYFTKAGKLRVGKQAAPILVLESDYEIAIAERQERIANQQRFEETSRAVEDARRKRRQARLEADTLRESVAQTRQQADVYVRLKAELDQKRQIEQSAKDRFDTVGQCLYLIGAARKEIVELRGKIENGEKLTDELSEERTSSAGSADEARRRRDDVRRRRSSLEERTAEVEDARAFVEDKKAQQTLATRLEKLRQFEANLKTHKERRAAFVAPDDKTIRETRKCVAAREKAEAALRASLIHLSVQPKKKTTIRRQSPKESKALTAGQTATFSGSPEVRLEVEGFGTIYASGPESDTETHQEAFQEAGRKLTKLTQSYGTQDPDRLQILRDQANDLEQKIQNQENQISGLLDDDAADDLNQQFADLDARIRERLKRFPAWKKQNPIVSDLHSALEKERKAVQKTVEAAEDAFDKAQSIAQAIEKRHGEACVELKNVRLNLDAVQGRLADLTKDGQSDEARARVRQEALMAWEAARTTAKECETKLNEIPGNPQNDLEKLGRQLKAMEEAESKARDEENQAEGRLQTLAAEGAYSKLVACEEKLGDLDTHIRRERLRMEATKLLYDTVNACKAALVAAVAAPVERTATHMLGRIAGPRLGTVQLTENFTPAGVHPEIAGATVELSNLSGGEQEQLFLVIRLALGHVLAKEQRQLVVLDDVLNATDSGRLGRVLTLLEESADRLQILVLTCHPERYRALENVSFFDLAGMIQTTAS